MKLPESAAGRLGKAALQGMLVDSRTMPLWHGIRAADFSLGETNPEAARRLPEPGKGWRPERLDARGPAWLSKEG